MITQKELFLVGKTTKPHGIKGELSFSFTKENFDETKLPYYIFEIEGIYVPFFVEDYRFKTDTTALIKLEGINNETEARTLSNHSVYIHTQFVLKEEEAEQGLEQLIGYLVEDKTLGRLGKIIEIDDTTANVLFVIDKDGEELLIPVTENFITEINQENTCIYMDLPLGLVKLEDADAE